MFSRVMFRWCDNPSGTSWPARRLWVESPGEDRGTMTFGALAGKVGEPEARRLVKVAIRRGCGKWHAASADWRFGPRVVRVMEGAA